MTRRSSPPQHKRLAALVFFFAVPLLGSDFAWGAYPARLGTRALGMGGAGRAAASGDSALMLNPSGMSLVRAYTVEGAYQLASAGNATNHFGHASIVDSTPSTRLSGGLYYTYVGGSAGQVDGRTHEAGAALSLPLGQSFMLGGLLRYADQRSTGANAATPVMPDSDTESSDESTRGLTFDMGATLRIHERLTLGIVGQNLLKEKSTTTPMNLGTGLALTPAGNLLLAFDTVVDLQSAELFHGEDTTSVSFMGGAEYVLESNLALRAGAGRDGFRKATYVSGGASLVSELGALDLGIHQDLSGQTRQTIVSVSARLFVPSP